MASATHIRRRTCGISSGMCCTQRWRGEESESIVSDIRTEKLSVPQSDHALP